MKHSKSQSPQLFARYALPFRCLAVVAVFLFSASAHAFEPKAINWKLDATVNNVEFYHAIAECNGQTTVFLRFVNKNTNAVKVSWKEAVTTQMRTESHPFRGDQKLTLQPGETMENSCSGTNCKTCVITPSQVNPTYLAKIADFSFKDITVSR